MLAQPFTDVSSSRKFSFCSVYNGNLSQSTLPAPIHQGHGAPASRQEAQRQLATANCSQEFQVVAGEHKGVMKICCNGGRH
ncbi:hypothetical protein Y1Q_0005121 [Alligator mississippiensis]|uniref:Uncharacterized protein n=1 Tax=Alligator mississippiensis TaxID=8496 RepID=A0A151MZL8_ALLMI|nr:hypothetical protein Y1Q_0005121 [Alligator mississippiensis]